MIVIMGPGQCGTTYFIQLFHALGVDPDGHLEIFREIPEEIKAKGKSFVWPEIIKGTGTLCVGLKDKSDYYGWDVEHIFFCYRQLDSMVRSRLGKRRITKEIRNLSKLEQYGALKTEIAATMGRGIDQLAHFDCPVTMVKFPKSLQDPDYRYSIFVPLGYTEDQIDEAHDEVGEMTKLRFGG